jgi:hypothetical protein
MQDLDRDELSLFIDASPEAVYDLVSDVTRTPEFSPEVLSCTWLDGATTAVPGARFKARNKVQRGPGWSNKPVVTVADRGRSFAFTRTELGGGTMEWSYRFEQEGTGTRVTESYELLRPMSAWMWFVIGTICGRKDRRSDLRAGMQVTLERLRGALEAQKPLGAPSSAT